jgi:hypothetical protein
MNESALNRKNDALKQKPAPALAFDEARVGTGFIVSDFQIISDWPD